MCINFSNFDVHYKTIAIITSSTWAGRVVDYDYMSHLYSGLVSPSIYVQLTL